MKKLSTNYKLPTIGHPKVALVTDWIYGGGSELVVEELHKLYPEAPIYTSYCSDEWRKRLNNKVITGYLQMPPFKQLRKFLPLLRQLWFKRLNLSDFDLVISITGNGEAKFAQAGPKQSWLHKIIKKNSTSQVSDIKYQVSGLRRPLHISYCNTPVHYYWRHYAQYIANPGFKPAWLARLGLKLLVRPLRARDYKAAQRVDYFVANSTHIQRDIKKFYGRDSVVIHPPVDIERFQLPSTNYKLPKARQGFVTMGRQVPYKKTEIIIQACKELGRPLTVIGRGPEHSRLVGMTGPTIHFKTEVTDQEMPGELASAEGFIFAAHEDFGVAPVEAMAAGTPVIAYKAGGALDYVIPGKTGEFFKEQSAESLAKVLSDFKPNKFRASALQDFAGKFSAGKFRKKFLDFVASLN